MISEISLEGVASYKSKASLKTDKKVNIIYGLNGSGKSTFSNYLYNLVDNSLEYDRCSCLHSNDNIIVYNQRFIKDNFHEVGNLKGIFSLSKENKDAIEKIESTSKLIEITKKDRKKIEELISQKESEILGEKKIAQQATWKIKQDYSGGDRVLEFCLRRLMGSATSLYDYISTIPLPLNKPHKTINELKEEASAIDGSTAVKFELCNEISLEQLPSEDSILLDTVIVGSEDSPVAELIVKLENSDWVSEGLKYLDIIDDNRCPFCQSNTLTSELICKIKSYFDETYQNKIIKLKEIQSSYKGLVDRLPELNEYNKSVYSTKFLSELTICHSEIEKLITENINLISDKIKTPSLRVKLHDFSSSIHNFNLLVSSINKLISEHNDKIDNSDKELERIKSEFWDILRLEYDHVIFSFNSKNSTFTTDIRLNKALLDSKIIQQKKEEAELIKYQKSTVNIEDAIININKGLSDLGITDFYIDTYQDDLYQIIRDGKGVDVFSSLSEGEKMIISFLYFREVVKGKKRLLRLKIKK